MLSFVKFGVRFVLVVFLIEYLAPDFLVNGVSTTAKIVGVGAADGLWSFFKTIGGHIIHP